MAVEDDPNLVSFMTPVKKSEDCVAVNSTTLKCTVKISAAPVDLERNSNAGTWKVAAWAFDKGNGGLSLDKYKTHLVQRASRLTVNASPEPVTKGKSITVTGKLSRANWETFDYRGYTGQPVKLQFRKKDSNTYITVKTVTTDSTGQLKTSVTAATDGYWRWNFAGTTTTPAVNAVGDYVDVR